MPDSSSGVYSLPSGYLAVTGQTVEATQHNGPLEDLASAMTRRMMRDGRSPMLGDIQMNGYRASGAADAENPQDYVTLAQVQALIASIASIPTGAMMFVASNVVPTGWIALNGQSVSRTTYAALWAYAQASGNLAATQGSKTVGQFGPGNGATTFTLPNLYADNGYFIRPLSSGRTIGSVQSDEIRSHGHSATFSGNPVPPHRHESKANGGGGNAFGNGVEGYSNQETSLAGGHTPSGTVTVNNTGGSETRPKNVAFPLLIKT